MMQIFLAWVTGLMSNGVWSRFGIMWKVHCNATLKRLLAIQAEISRRYLDVFLVFRGKIQAGNIHVGMVIDIECEFWG